MVNLGSLVVRTAFQPFEEAAFTSFSTSGKCGAFQCDFTTAMYWLGQMHCQMHRWIISWHDVTCKPDGRHTGDKQQSARLLALLVRIVAIVGSLSAAFGPAYAWLLLHLLYGPRWSATAAPAALSLYSWFILLLAVSAMPHAHVCHLRLRFTCLEAQASHRLYECCRLHTAGQWHPRSICACISQQPPAGTHQHWAGCVCRRPPSTERPARAPGGCAW